VLTAIDLVTLTLTANQPVNYNFMFRIPIRQKKLDLAGRPSSMFMILFNRVPFKTSKYQTKVMLFFEAR